MLTPDQLDHFNTEGYIVIDGVRDDLMQPVREASDRVVQRARRGDWPHVRRADGDLWGVSSLLHPDLNESVFFEYLASDQVVEVARDLLGFDRLRLGLTNMLINPATKDHAIGWHRDAGSPDQVGDEELAHLTKFMSGVQWNCALYDESCLLVVPGSHRRNLSDAERSVWRDRPMESMPGEMKVHLTPGRTVYYNALILHRGVYPTATRRETLHANFVSRRHPDQDDFALHYNAVAYMADEGFRARLPEKLLPLHDEWLAFAEQFQ